MDLDEKENVAKDTAANILRDLKGKLEDFTTGENEEEHFLRNIDV